MKKKIQLQMYLLAAPAIILFFVFVFFPFIQGIKISFTNWNGYSQSSTFVGFNNYIKLLDDDIFKRAFQNTLIYGLVCTIIQNILGLFYAVFVNKKFATRNMVRLFIYLPSIISGVVIGYMMYNMFQYSNGALNDIMHLFGLSSKDWLGDGNVALMILVIVNSLQFVGVAMMLYLAGLQNIPKSVLEASLIDGASKTQTFRHVTLPLLVPAMKSSFIINLIGGLQLFGVIIAMTNGGPGNATHSISTLINYRHFSNEDAGGAAAIGLVLFIIVFIISFITNKYFKSKEVEM